MDEGIQKKFSGKREVIFLSPPEEHQFLLQDILKRHSKTAVISLVGAGGKTSTLFWLARALYQQGLRVLITTTTAMAYPLPAWVEQCYFDFAFANFFQHPNHPFQNQSGPGLSAAFSALDSQVQKVRGYTPAEIDCLKSAGFFDVILVEADGARGQNIKAADTHEPQLPESSDYVIGLTGFPVFTQPVSSHQVHRWPIFSKRFEVEEGAYLDVEFFNRYLNHPEGLFKSAPNSAQKHWVLNAYTKADNSADAVVESLALAHSWLDGVWLVAMQSAHPLMRAWVRRCD